MARIKIEDLPGDKSISSQEMRNVFGGGIILTDMQMGSDLQYLQLQQDLQTELSQYTMLSNIMKTRHDTAKNSINNIR
jgi:hypothetical protein